jgi:hypothetical protein
MSLKEACTLLLVPAGVQAPTKCGAADAERLSAAAGEALRLKRRKSVGMSRTLSGIRDASVSHPVSAITPL